MVFLKVLLYISGTIVFLLTALYVQVFVIGKKRKRLTFDPVEEAKRAATYPPPFPNGWFSLCSSDSVKNGQVIEVNAFGKKYAVFRSKAGKLGVMDAYCPHLNANLADGWVKGEHLVCPFHGWEFDTDGKCAKVQYSDKLPPCDTMHKLVYQEAWGVVMLWHHTENAPPSWQTDGYIEELKDYKYHSKTSDVLRIHLQDFAENGADFAHFNFIHNLLTIPFANRFVNVHHTVKIQFPETEEKHTVMFSDQADLVWKSSGKLIPHAGGYATVTYYGPGFLVFRFTTRMGNMLLVKTFTPLGPLMVRMEDFVYAPQNTNRIAIKYLLGEASAQFHDDIKIWERKNYAVKPLLVKGDGPIMKMRAWYSQFYSDYKHPGKKETVLATMEESGVL